MVKPNYRLQNTIIHEQKYEGTGLCDHILWQFNPY